MRRTPLIPPRARTGPAAKQSFSSRACFRGSVFPCCCAGIFFERGRYSSLGLVLVGLEAVVVAATGFSWRLTTRARQRPGSPGGGYSCVSTVVEEQLEQMLLPASRVMDREGGGVAPRRSGSNASLLSAQPGGHGDGEED